MHCLVRRVCTLVLHSKVTLGDRFTGHSLLMLSSSENAEVALYDADLMQSRYINVLCVRTTTYTVSFHNHIRA